MPTDSSPYADLKQEATESMRRSHGSFELAFAPLILALLGLWLDRSVGTTPLFALLFALVGILGVFAKIYYSYKNSMLELGQNAAWSEHASSREFRAAAAARAQRLSIPRENGAGRNPR